MKLFYPLAFLALGSATAHAAADYKAAQVHVADDKKTQAYIKDGLIVGGDKAVDQVLIKDIRRAKNPGFERVVIDLEGSTNGEPTAIPRAPYFQVNVAPDERRVVFTIFGRSRLGFSSKKVLAAFKKSSVIEDVVLLPKLEDDAWTFAFDLKEGHAVEVFELGSPVRVIADIQTARKITK